MKVTLYIAISIDGLITRGGNDSDWVSDSDWSEFYSFVQSSNAIMMGRKTMEQFEESDLPVGNKPNIIISSNSSLENKSKDLHVVSNPEEAIKYATDKGFVNLLLIGGSETNKSFLKNNLIDEIVLSVHPLAIGNGLSLFGKESIDLKLQLISSKTVNNELVQINYKVVRN